MLPCAQASALRPGALPKTEVSSVTLGIGHWIHKGKQKDLEFGASQLLASVD